MYQDKSQQISRSIRICASKANKVIGKLRSIVLDSMYVSFKMSDNPVLGVKLLIHLFYSTFM